MFVTLIFGLVFTNAAILTSKYKKAMLFSLSKNTNTSRQQYDKQQRKYLDECSICPISWCILLSMCKYIILNKMSYLSSSYSPVSFRPSTPSRNWNRVWNGSFQKLTSALCVLLFLCCDSLSIAIISDFLDQNKYPKCCFVQFKGKIKGLCPLNSV